VFYQPTTLFSSFTFVFLKTHDNNLYITTATVNNTCKYRSEKWYL